MSRYHSYLNSATTILSQYDGSEPFAGFLKKYFAANKKIGSRDRKHISHLCYCYFRLGKASLEIPAPERILLALFLCAHEPNEILEALDPDRNRDITLGLTEKLNLAAVGPGYIFPWPGELSDGMEHKAFALSHLQQPDLFLRMRPGKEKAVKEKLKQAGIRFSETDDEGLVLPNASKIDEVLVMDRDVVVQDRSSQETGHLLKDNFAEAPLKIWDCCAASGGKSIMLMDMFQQAQLTVSDIRQSIIINLRKRFDRAGIEAYESFIADLTKPLQSDEQFDLIVADAPCSGSGTWGRTPEQLFFFNEKRIGEYANLQRTILSNVVPHLQPGGFLLYITCSVFKKENEAQVEWLKEKFQLQLVKMELIKGYDKKADTMFAALLQNPL